MKIKTLKVCFLVAILLSCCLSFVYASDSKLLITSDTAVNDRWFRVKSEAPFYLSATNRPFQKQGLSILLFFSDPGIDDNGRAKMYYDLKILGPDGRTLSESKHIKVVDGKISQDKIIRLSQGISQIDFDDELAGKYLVEVDVTDEVAHTVQHLQQELELREYTYQKHFTNIAMYNNWEKNYYKELTAENIIDGLFYFASRNVDANNKHYGFACGFYTRALNDNLYLVPQLLKLYPEQSEAVKVMILSILPHINYDVSDFINQLSVNDKNFYIAWQKKGIQYRDDEIQAQPKKMQDVVNISYQMDMLWGNFFASGSYKPIKALVDLLDLGQYKGNFALYKENKAADEERAALDLVYQTAKWSLEKNCRSHPLVRDYCNYIYDNEKLSPQAKQELKEIMEKYKIGELATE